MLTLLPFYLVRERHLSMQTMVKVASAYYAVEGLSAIATGWFSDFFIRRNYTPTLVRKSAMAIGHVVAAIALAGCFMATSHWYLLCLVAVGSAAELYVPGHSRFRRPSPAGMQPENGRGCKTAS